MKYLGWILGIVLVAGAAYAGYYYGTGQMSVTNDVVEEDTDNDDSTQDNDNDFDIFNGDSDNDGDDEPVYAGPTYVRIDYPANGAVVHTQEPFQLRGSSSSNAKTIMVKVYEQVYRDTDGTGGLGAPNAEKLVDTYTLKNFKLGDTSWTYQLSYDFGNVTYEAHGARYVVRADFTDNTYKESQVTVTYVQAVAEMGKPVVYLYPETLMPVSVNVTPTDGISVSEPEIGNGWNVLASPDGKIINSDGTIWPYLFWEGFANNFITPKEGFVIARSEVSQFFDDKLAFLGLNKKEIADFKEFWVPRMQAKPYYFVSFIHKAVFDSYAPLTISPQPTTIIRVFFDHKGLNEEIVVPEQILKPAPARKGFTVIEWGGRLYR